MAEARGGPSVRAAVLVVTACFAVVAWSGVEQYKSSGGDDEVAFRGLADGLYANHRLPGPSENAEYALPPGVPALGAAMTWASSPVRSDRPSPPLQSLPRLVRRLLWLALVAAGALLAARPPPQRLIGAGLLLAATAWAWSYVSAASDNEAWLPLVLIDYASAVALIPLTAWLAHEVSPESRRAPVLAALGAALLPPVFAASLYFHPDPPFAVLAATATALVVRAARTGLTVRLGVAAGAVLGAAALTRQSAVLVAFALVLGVVVVHRRSAARYALVLSLAMLVVAGPWWYRQYDRYGNPFQSNLDRQGYMLDHEPASFYVSLPGALVTHPYRYSFDNELFPRFHAFLWSDRGGNYHDWNEPKRFARFLASSQSVLGFGADALVLAGVALFGVRAVRRREPALAVLTTLFVVSWAGYIATLVRFPQKGGDPIKAHYLLFLAPVCVVFALAAGRALTRRGGWTRAVTLGWLALYAVSWVLTLATAF